MNSNSDRYRIVKFLGHGRYGDVYEFYDTFKSGRVAIKMFSNDKKSKKNIKSFWAEVQAMRIVSHCNVLKILEVHLDYETELFNREKRVQDIIVLELCERGDLYCFMEKNGCLSDELCLKFTEQLLKGVQALHRAGICHRDIKPDNLLIDSDFNLKIADFGYAHLFDPDMIPMYSESCGTRQYVAPEVLVSGGKFKYDGKKADIWSIGVVCFIFALGYPPMHVAHRSDFWFCLLNNPTYDDFWKTHLKYTYREVSQNYKLLIEKTLVVNSMLRSNIECIVAFFDEEIKRIDEIKTIHEFKRHNENEVHKEENKNKCMCCSCCIVV